MPSRINYLIVLFQCRYDTLLPDTIVVPTLQVLIMDEMTVKVMSYSCKMADITDEGISCKLVIYFYCFFSLQSVAMWPFVYTCNMVVTCVTMPFLHILCRVMNRPAVYILDCG